MCLKKCSKQKNPQIPLPLQGMLLQIATNWRALHPAVRPRAVWVCAAHLRFKSTLDSGWNGIVDAGGPDRAGRLYVRVWCLRARARVCVCRGGYVPVV